MRLKGRSKGLLAYIIHVDLGDVTSERRYVTRCDIFGSIGSRKSCRLYLENNSRGRKTGLDLKLVCFDCEFCHLNEQVL